MQNSAEMSGIEIVRRVNMLKSLRSNIEAIWNDVERYVMPLRIGNMYQRPMTEHMVEWSREDIYDSTAIWSAQKFAASIHGTLMNPLYRWFELEFKDRKLSLDPQAKGWLQECTDIMYDELYDSNFDAEASSACQDLVGVGNTIFTTEIEKEDPEDWQGFNFSAIPVKEMFFERDHRGDMYNVYRWLEWTALEIKSKWKDDNKPLPPEVEKELKEGGDVTKKFAVIFTVYTVEANRKNRGSMRALAEDQRPFGSKYVMHPTGIELGDIKGYYEMPANHCPWERTSGSMWGHGPGMVMVPTIKYINAWLEMQDMAVRKQIDPPWLVRERGLLGDLNQKPGAQIPVKDPERDVKALLAAGRIDFSQMTLKELRDMVREAFHENELQLKDSPQMSATEAQIRYELMNRVLGPTMGHVNRNMLSPTLVRMFMSLLRNKQFPDIPAAVAEAKAQFRVRYSGPLVRAQRMDEVTGMERFMGQIGAIAKIYPPIMNVVDPVKYAREMARKMDITADILRDEATVTKMQKQQEAAQARQTQAVISEQEGKAAQAQQQGQPQQPNGAP